jgi:hypothetical protein
MRSSSLGAGSTVRASDIGNLDDLPVVLGCQLGAPLHRKLGRTAEAGQVHRLYIAVTKKAGSQLICPRLLTVVIIQGQRPETSLLTSHMTQPLATEGRVLKRLVQSLPCKSQAFARSVPFAPR